VKRVDSDAIEQLWRDAVSGRLSRRDVLRRGAAFGLSSTVIASLLAACGGGSSTATTSSGSGASTGAATPVSTVAPAAQASASGSPIAGTAAAGKPGGQLTVGHAVFQTLDPHVTSSLGDYLFMATVFDQLVNLTPQGTLYPALATQWSVSSDGLQWTFKLRNDVKFHDGTPFNADAVKFNLDRVVDPATKSQGAIFFLGPYDSTTVIDDFTVRVNLKRPYSPLPAELAAPALSMVSPAAVAKYGAAFAQNPVGSGPFMFKELVENNHVTVVRNPDYNWASAAHHHQGPAYLDQVKFQFIPEPSTLTAALRTGQINAGGVQASDWANLSGQGFTTTKCLVDGFPPAGYFINVTKPPTDDINVRKAIISALNFDEINAAIFNGTGTASHGIISPFNWAYDPASALYPFDATKANSLLDQSGWVKSGDYRTKNGETLTLVNVSFTTLGDLDAAIQAQLKVVGIKVVIQEEQYAAYQADTQGGKHNIAWTQWSGLDPADLHKIFGSENIGSGWNLSHYKNANVDDLLKQGETVSDATQRKTIYGQLQTQVMQDAVFAPLYNYTILWAFKKGIMGTDVLDPTGSSPLPYDMYITD
jgi:peptide/nickel transport system substrate-binding protein